MTSNCTKEEYQARVRELNALREGKCAEVASVPPLPIFTDCIHADDTKQVNPNCKCKGTKIICKHPTNIGFSNYSKYCNKNNCKYYTGSSSS